MRLVRITIPPMMHTATVSDDHALPPARPAGLPPLPPAPARRRRLDSEALFDGEVEIEIEHRMQVYRLRKTALGKLILTK